MELCIALNFANNRTEERYTERVKVGRSTSPISQVQQADRAISSLCLAKPYKVTFELPNEVDGTPKDIDLIFCMLGHPFRQLKSSCFDAQLTYTSGTSSDGYGEWDLGSSYLWRDHRLDL
jgi:hypothetical protein